jgi:CheY-like chemotaxis protein
MREVYLQDLWTKGLPGDSGRNGIAVTSFPCVMGRHPECDYRIRSPLISRRHCCLHLQGEQVCVQDLGSLNGTLLNGQPVHGVQPLQEGDLLQLAYLTFRVRLPALPEAPVVDPGAVDRARESRQERHQVLVVEDNADAAATLARLLTGWGYEVHVAHDGAEALQAAQAHPPDTVLLDICLPGMDGYQVAQRLRSEAGLEKTRLVGMTGYVQEAQDRPQAVGLNGLLTKPVDPEALQELISQRS